MPRGCTCWRPAGPPRATPPRRGNTRIGPAPRARQHLDRLAKQESASSRVLTLRATLAIQSKDFAALQGCLDAGQANGAFDARSLADFYFQAGEALRAAGPPGGGD